MQKKPAGWNTMPMMTKLDTKPGCLHQGYMAAGLAWAGLCDGGNEGGVHKYSRFMIYDC
jgi:hypothetical protein